jgi:hypothetical protein
MPTAPRAQKETNPVNKLKNPPTPAMPAAAHSDRFRAIIAAEMEHLVRLLADIGEGYSLAVLLETSNLTLRVEACPDDARLSLEECAIIVSDNLELTEREMMVARMWGHFRLHRCHPRGLPITEREEREAEFYAESLMAMLSTKKLPAAQGQRRRPLLEAVEALIFEPLPWSDDEPLKLDVAKTLAAYHASLEVTSEDR